MNRLPFKSLHIFQVEKGYGDDEYWVNIRMGQLSIHGIEQTDKRWPSLRVTGLRPTDFAAFIMHVPRFTWQRRNDFTAGYLVTHEGGGEGIITSADMVESDPNRWVTPRLEYLARSLDVSELHELSLNKLSEYLLFATVENPAT